MDLSFVRKDLARLYVDSCSIIECRKVVDANGIHHEEEITVHENIPCKLTHKTITQVADGVEPKTTLVSKLNLSPDIEIKPGSKIIVFRAGVSTVYKNSGQPARHLNHQAITLELEDERA